MIKDPSKYFYCCDGSVLRSLGEFKKAMGTMPDEVYAYHVERDDFAKWVDGVVKNKPLAKKLSGADKKKAKQVLGVKAPKAKKASAKPKAAKKKAAKK